MSAETLIQIAAILCVAAVILVVGRLRTRNPATRLEATPPLTSADKTRYALGFLAVIAVCVYALFFRDR